jgi:hypothetical protein
MAVCSINNSEFDIIPVNSELNTISVDSINAFSNILECKIDSKDIVLEKVGDIDGQPLVILELNINGTEYVTEAVITDDKDSYIKINENNLHGVVKPEPKKEVIKEEKEEEIISEERLEEMNKISAGNDISAVLAESLTNYNTKKLNEELKNYENIYNTKVQEFEDKKREILNLVETQFTNNVNILKEDVDKKVDLFFKKTDLNNKTSIAIETDRLKDAINEKYEDFIEELNQKKDLISEDNNEHANKLIKLVEKKEKELKDSVKVFVEKIYNNHQQELNPQIENIINENKQLNEKIEKLEALKNDLVDNKVYSEDLSKSESNLRKLLKDTNKKFNKINEKFKVLSEKDNKRYNSLLAAINNTNTKEYETVLNNKIEEAELGQIKEELEQRITSNMQNEMTSLKRYVEMSSGGGSVAVQYANGGVMNGDLKVTGTLTAGTLLSATQVDFVKETDGFNVTGDVVANNIVATSTLGGTLSTAAQPNVTTINALEIRETTDSSSYAILGHSSVIPATVGSLQSLGGGYAFASQSLGNTYINKKADRSMYFESGGVTKVKFDSFDNWTFYNGTRVQITNPTGPSEGLRFTHSASGPANDEFNMYYAGSAAGAPFVLNKEGTGNAEIVFFNNGDVNINGGYQGSGTGNEDNNVGIGVNGQTKTNTGGFNTSAKPTNKLHVFEETGKTMGDFVGSSFGLSKSGALVRIESGNGQNLFLDGKTIAGDDQLNIVAESGIVLGPNKVLTTIITEDRTIHGKPVRFASYTTTERDALSPGNGDVIYNTTDDKFQGYAGGAWVNLH